MPAPTPDQEKLVKLVTNFRGISQSKSIVQSTMDHATDLVNVMVSSIGNLEKFRYPTALTTTKPAFLVAGVQGFIDTLFMFTQGNGTRQLFANPGPGLGYYHDPENGTDLVFNAIVEDPALYRGRMRYVSSNNLLFMGNGITVRKWTGALLLKWGLPQPTLPPQLGWTVPITNIQRVGNLITISFNVSAFPLPQQSMINAPAIGSLMSVSGVAEDATLNGNFLVSALPGVGQVTLTCPTAGNVGPYVDGFLTLYSVPCANTGISTDFNIPRVQRINGVTTIIVQGLNERIGQYLGELVTISGLTGAFVSFNGIFPIAAVSNTLGEIVFDQLLPDVLSVMPTGVGVATGGFSNLVSPRTWRFSWAISATGEEGPASDISIFIPDSNGGLVSHSRSLLVIPPPPAGYGIDSYYLYANEDGGGVWETVPGPGLNGITSCWPIPDVTKSTFISDGFDDSVLDPTFPANFINFPPPQNARFLQKWQGRIFIGGMPDAPQDIVYSGYDQIYRGRPEASYPPFNRIRLAIGADELAGFGVLLNGVIAWDNSDKMYMFSGTIQDITTTQPVQIADQLEEEPWQVGLSSADSVQSTPRGVVWVGADMTVQIWNGIFYGEIVGPRCLSPNFYPYMRRITPSMRPNIQSAYFNWLERDWYAILVALDGSVFPTHIFFFDLSEASAEDNMGIWVTNIACDSIAVKVDSKGTRSLVASIGGIIKQLNISSTSTDGIHRAPTATTALLDAFWDSGYWQDMPHRTKMFRYGRLVADQTGFDLISTVLNDETSKFRDINPYSKHLKLTTGGRFAVNRKGRRAKFRINFPRQDVDASVLELYITAIPIADI